MAASSTLTERVSQEQFSLRVFIKKTSSSLEEKLLRYTLGQLELGIIRKPFSPHPQNYKVLAYDNEMGGDDLKLVADAIELVQ